MGSSLLNRRCIIRFVIILFVCGMGLFVLQPHVKELETLSQTPQMDDIPMIYLITPTYSRLTQKVDLVRLSQTLMSVKRLTWIVVEDAKNKTKLVSNLLKNSGLNYVHLNAVTVKNKTTSGKRGIMQRNKALQWIREHTSPNNSNGVAYFGDDDNAYSIELFEEMRYTKKVSVWPVGLVGGTKWEAPLCKNGKVVGFDVVHAPGREFPLDMAAFAFNIKLLHDRPQAQFYFSFTSGRIEGDFIKILGMTRADLEPKGKNCTMIYAWHTKTQSRFRRYPKKYKGPNLEV